MTANEKRLRALEQTMRQHSLMSLKRWLNGLTDLELAMITATAIDLDAEIFMLLLVCDDAEVRAAVSQI
jgi:hypothetical protein